MDSQNAGGADKMDDPRDDEPRGTVDLASVLYVVGGIPAMIAFFLILFGLVGSCDSANVLFPA